MDAIGADQIELRVHGLTEADHGRVPARVFAAKLSQLVSVLEASDVIANGVVTRSYLIAALHTSQPTAVLKEVPFEDASEGSTSAIPALIAGVDAIKTHDVGIADRRRFVSSIVRFTHGAAKGFGFAEVRTSGADIIRIDDFLRRRAKSISTSAPLPFYSGASIGSFDGTLAYVDARGALPQIKLILTAGGIELDCICRQDDIDALGESLNHRVRVHGRAIYNGDNPLPMRVEVSSIEPVKREPDFRHWMGSFRPFSIPSWEGDA